MVPLQDPAAASPPAAWRRDTAPPGVELGPGSAHWHQSVGGSHHSGCGYVGVGLRAQPDRTADRFICGGSAAPAAVLAVHSIRCIPVSHTAPAAQPAANRASKPPSYAPVSLHLAMGMHALVVWGVVAAIAMPLLAMYLRRAMVLMMRRHRTLLRSRPAVH